MKFSENWLREWVDPAVDTETLCEQLTMAGLEVDAVMPAAPAALDGVVVGHVTDVQPHPQADAVQVCQVVCGSNKTVTVVCGAPNAAPGLRAPLALPGARLPSGHQIEQSDIRGVASAGMLCSGAELGLSDDAAGLMPLDADAEE